MKSLHKAFTLIECVTVVSLLLLTLLLCFSSFSWMNRMLIRLELERFCTLCNMLQQKALAQQKEIHCLIDIEHNTCIYEQEIYELPKQIKIGFLPNTYGPPGSPNKLITKPVTFLQKTIIFYPSGIISSGTIYIIDQSNQYMYALSNAVSLFSYIRLYRYEEKKKWKLL